MADQITFRSLIQAIAGAITSAQQEVERQQILNLGAYFDINKRPIMMSRRLPSIRFGAEPGAEDVLEVPALTLLPVSPLQISEVSVEFDVEFGGLQVEGDVIATPAVRALNADDDPNAPSPQVRRILVSPFNGAPSAKGPKAHVVIKVRETEVPEGLARLLTELNKMHGSRPDVPKT
jgi:hypothetical protein